MSRETPAPLNQATYLKLQRAPEDDLTYLPLSKASGGSGQSKGHKCPAQDLLRG